MHSIILLLHVISATIWTGGHLVLSLGFLPKALANNNPDIVNNFESIYEKIGIPSLLTQIVTGVLLAYNYFPTFTDFFGFSNHLQTHLTYKFILLGLTAILALDARLRIIPKLGTHNLKALAWHIIPVTILSVLFVVVGVSFKNGIL